MKVRGRDPWSVLLSFPLCWVGELRRGLVIGGRGGSYVRGCASGGKGFGFVIPNQLDGYVCMGVNTVKRGRARIFEFECLKSNGDLCTVCLLEMECIGTDGRGLSS